MKIRFFIISSVFFVITLLINVTISNADTIILKSGQSIVVDMAWEEGDSIRCTKAGGIIGFPKDSVEKIVYEEDDENGNESFQFDMWKGGITINQAMQIAESHDLPIKKVGIISSATKFSSSVYKYINSAENFYYKTTLMGKNAKVTLCFTPTTRLLYKVDVSLYGTGVNRTGEYRDEIEAMLSKNYGKPHKSKGLFEDRCIWNIGNKYTVSMVSRQTEIDIVYSDNSLDKTNTIENQKIKDKEKSNYTRKDSHKF
jgi:hypothetical protein